jgi:hypothetical protein
MDREESIVLMYLILMKGRGGGLFPRGYIKKGIFLFLGGKGVKSPDIIGWEYWRELGRRCHFEKPFLIFS